MKDINPIKKRIPLKKVDPEDKGDFRSSAGIDTEPEEKDEDELVEEEAPAPARPIGMISNEPMSREERAFTSLYPESRIRTTERPKQRFETRKPIKSKGDKKFFSASRLAGMFGALVVAGLFSYTFFLASATVTITPLKTSFEVSRPISISETDIAIGDVVVVTASSSQTKSIARRGVTKVETKASGTITISNNFDANPQRLITNTRFESSTGKVYRIAQSVTVPGIKNGAPGTLDVEVFADSIGADHNTSKETFTIPGFKGTARYDKFSAKTKTAITGGASGNISVVADKDVQDARDALSASVRAELDSKIKKLSPSDSFVLLEGVTSYKEYDNRTELRTDSKVDYMLTQEAKAYFVKKNYLSDKIIEVSNHTEDEKLMLSDVTGLTFGSSTTTATSSASITFKVLGTPTFVSTIDETSIKGSLKGAKKSDFSKIMSGYKEILQASPSLYPFWIRSFPSDTNKIKIVVLN